MPAKSKSQQRLMGMVYSYKKSGTLPTNPGLAKKIKEIAKSITKKEAEKFARTKLKGIPDHVSENTTFKQFLQEWWDGKGIE